MILNVRLMMDSSPWTPVIDGDNHYSSTSKCSEELKQHKEYECALKFIDYIKFHILFSNLDFTLFSET